jgi:hypothetical protein
MNKKQNVHSGQQSVHNAIAANTLNVTKATSPVWGANDRLIGHINTNRPRKDSPAALPNFALQIIPGLGHKAASNHNSADQARE